MKKYLFGILFFLLFACIGRREKTSGVISSEVALEKGIRRSAWKAVKVPPVVSAETETERRMRELGLVDVREVDSSIRVQLIYGTNDNFVGRVLYNDLRKAFLLPQAAQCLAEAQKKLKVERHDLNLLVYDAARPMSVQQEMWELVKGTANHIYVSNPRNGGGLHNYGAAVDVTIIDSLGQPLPMGSEFDYFGDESRPDREEDMLREKRITLSHLHNRRLLRRVMVEAGFCVLPGEWWHFNLISRQEAIKTLRVIE